MVLVYLFRNLFLSIFLFFKHWYVDSFGVILGRALGIVRNLERQLALKINIRFLFQPLYQEHNIYGYVLGFLFRAFRIVVGFLGYLIIMLCGVLVYIFWASIPVFLIYKIISGK